MPERSVVGVVKAKKGQDLHLLAGQLYFGGDAAQVRTLLGSCVAIALWHPRRRLGGLCHFLLPERVCTSAMPLDGRFGNEAVAILLKAIAAAGTVPQEYNAYLYGGADTMPDSVGVKFAVGERNIELGWSLIEAHGFTLQEVDVGDNVPRTVTLNLVSGEVSMRRGQPTTGGQPIPVPTVKAPAWASKLF
ncbi:MAG: chemotaxis protein CheD [Pseudomonadota bacterium]